MQSLLPREKRLLLIAFILALLVYFTPSLLQNYQLENLQSIRRHISNIQPQWQEFQRRNSGFEFVHLFDYTGGDGMFGAYGYVPSDEHLARLREFMQATHPPRPVYLESVQPLGGEEEFKLFKNQRRVEPDVPANGSRSIR